MRLNLCTETQLPSIIICVTTGLKDFSLQMNFKTLNAHSKQNSSKQKNPKKPINLNEYHFLKYCVHLYLILKLSCAVLR